MQELFIGLYGRTCDLAFIWRWRRLEVMHSVGIGVQQDRPGDTQIVECIFPLHLQVYLDENSIKCLNILYLSTCSNDSLPSLLRTSRASVP